MGKEPVWVLPDIIFSVHEKQIAEHGGLSGLRDKNLLESALAKPQQLYNYGTPDLYDLAASYAIGIAKNHLFLDGNKRTAFLACYIFLRINGIAFQAPEIDVVQKMLTLADGRISELEFAAWLRSYDLEKQA